MKNPWKKGKKIPYSFAFTRLTEADRRYFAKSDYKIMNTQEAERLFETYNKKVHTNQT